MVRRPPRNRLRLGIDRALFPLLVFLSPEASRAMGLTPLDDERIEMCLRYAKGFLLDVGCGNNSIVRQHRGGGIGLDVHNWPNIDLVASAEALPFKRQSFDTVTMAAMLNHIDAPNRKAALLEARRVLRPGGCLLITMIGPLIGMAAHRLRRRYDPDQLERGIGHEESLGLSDMDVRQLLDSAGFRLRERVGFVWGLNAIFVCEPNPGP